MFLNVIIYENRLIVLDIVGIIRDSVKSVVELRGYKIEIIDIVGIIRKSKIDDIVEYLVFKRVMLLFDEFDLFIVLIDLIRELVYFDVRIIGYVFENNKLIIICVNKWDLINKI